MKKFYLATFAVIATVILAACGEINKQTRKKTRRLPLPCNGIFKRYLEIAKKEAEKKGTKLTLWK